MNTPRGVVLGGISDVFSKASSIATFNLFATYAGVSAYGAYGQLFTFIGFLLPFVTVGLGDAMVRFFAAEPWSTNVRARYLRVVALVLLIAGAGGALLWILAGSVNDLLLHWVQGSTLFRWGAPLVVLGALEQVLYPMFRARYWIVQLALMQIAFTACWVGTCVVILPRGWGIVALVQAVIVVKMAFLLIGFTSLWAWNRPKMAAVELPPISLGRMIRFGVPMTIAGFGLFLMNLGDRFMIGHFMEPADLGVYAAVYTVASLTIGLNYPLNLPLYPRLVKALTANSPSLVGREVRLFHRYGTLIIVPGSVFLAFMAQPILMVLSRNALRTSFLLGVILVSAVALNQWNSVAHYVLVSHNEAVFSQNVWLAMGALNVVANIFAVPRFGLEGAAFVTFATFVVLDILFFRRACKYAPLASLYQWRLGAKTVAASVAAGFASWGALLAFRVDVAPLLLAGLVFLGLFIGLMVLMRELGSSDFAIVARAFHGRSS